MPHQFDKRSLESFDQRICEVERRIHAMQVLTEQSKAVGWPTDVPEQMALYLMELSTIIQTARRRMTRE